MTSVVPPWYAEIAQLTKKSTFLRDDEKKELSDLLEKPINMQMHFNKPENLDKFRRVLTGELTKFIHNKDKLWVHIGKIERNPALTEEERSAIRELANILHLWGVAHYIK